MTISQSSKHIRGFGRRTLCRSERVQRHKLPGDRLEIDGDLPILRRSERGLALQQPLEQREPQDFSGSELQGTANHR